MTTDKRGFTYIELTVTLVVLLLVASLAMPNLKHLAEGQEIATFKTDLKTLPVSARELAISNGQTVQVTYDDQESQLVVSAIQETASAGQGSESSTDDGEEGTTLRTIPVPGTVEASSYMYQGVEADAGNWSIRFYPDGTSEAGGIGFEAGNYQFSLTIRDDGRGAVVDGDIPDLSTESWKAGDYEQRTQ